MQRYRDTVLREGSAGLQPTRNATITVFNHGTDVVAAIYETNTYAPKANPFKANAQGAFYFYADNGRYDVLVQGFGVEVRLDDVLMEDVIDEIDDLDLLAVKKPELSSAAGTGMVGGQQPFPNARTRTQAERNLERPSSKDVVAATTAEEVQKASAAVLASNGGGTLLVPAGPITGSFQVPAYGVRIVYDGPANRGNLGGLGGDTVRFNHSELTYLPGPHPTYQLHANHLRVLAKGSNQIGAQFGDYALGITAEKENWSETSGVPVAGELNVMTLFLRNGRKDGDPVKTGGAGFLGNFGQTDGSGYTQTGEFVNSVFSKEPGLPVIKQTNLQIQGIDTVTGTSYIISATSNVGNQTGVLRAAGTTASRWGRLLETLIDGSYRFRILDDGEHNWRLGRTVTLKQEAGTNDMVWLNESGVEILRLSEAKGIAQSRTRTISKSGASVAPASDEGDCIISAFHTAAMVMTLPNNFPAGFKLRVLQRDAASQITFTPAAGATLRNVDGHTKTKGLHAIADLVVNTNSSGTNAVWYLTGQTAA